MALKPDRDFSEVTDIANHWLDDSTQDTKEKGGIASIVSQSSGVAMDDSGNVVSYVADPSGAFPKGVLLQDVNPPLSSTRDFKNFANLEVRPGEKVTLVRKGWLVTDQIPIADTIVAGDAAFLGASGLITNDPVAGASGVGRFETSTDADNFAKIYIDI